jgi:hypothetical protein
MKIYNWETYLASCNFIYIAITHYNFKNYYLYPILIKKIQI